MYFFLCLVLPVSNPHSGIVLFLKHNQVSSLPCSARSCLQHHLWVIKKRQAKWGMIWDVQFRNVGFPWSQLQESFPKCSNRLLPYAEVIQRELSVRKTRSSAKTGKGLLRGHSKYAFSPTAHKVGLLIPFFTLLPTSNFCPHQFPSCIFLKVIMYFPRQCTGLKAVWIAGAL